MQYLVTGKKLFYEFLLITLREYHYWEENNNFISATYKKLRSYHFYSSLRIFFLIK